MRALPVLAALAALLAAPAASAQVVTGRLLEEGTNRPIARATVELMVNGTSRRNRTVTDSAGAFSLYVPGKGTYQLRATRIGYATSLSRSLDIATIDSLDVVFRLAANTVVLEPLQVTAVPRRLPPWLTGFYDRVENNPFGRFVTRSQIASYQPYRASDVLRTLAGVSVTPHRSGHGNVVRVRGCVPLFYVDGMLVELHGTSIDDYLSPRDLEGIEVYAGPSNIPAEFSRANRGNGCGAIVVWTRLDQ